MEARYPADAPRLVLAHSLVDADVRARRLHGESVRAQLLAGALCRALDAEEGGHGASAAVVEGAFADAGLAPGGGYVSWAAAVLKLAHGPSLALGAAFCEAGDRRWREEGQRARSLFSLSLGLAHGAGERVGPAPPRAAIGSRRR